MKKTSVLLLGLSFTFLFHEAHPATITFTNNCAYTVWPATLTGGSRPQLSSTGFQLATKETQSLDVPAPFTGRFWGRTHCTTNSSSGKFICATGDCGSGQLSCNGAGGNPPISLIEFTLAENHGQDFYDVSLVDGFNVPISVSPQGGSGNNCTSSSCAADVNSVCPTELAVKGSDGGTTISCKSACEEFNQPEYCCTGNFQTPLTCKPSSYSMIFKDQCPQAYSYAYDDLTSTFSCSGGANYAVIFCP